jgi:hypothetical protein
MIVESFFVFFLLRDDFSKPVIGLADPQISFALTLMPLGLLVFKFPFEPVNNGIRRHRSEAMTRAVNYTVNNYIVIQLKI